MSLTVTLKVNSSPVEKIGKTLTAGNDYSCVLKDSCSILKPVITIRTTDSIIGFNYMYISDLNRYYFIDDIISLHDCEWQISGHVDVLETYKTAILANKAVIKRQAHLYNLYLDDPEFHVLNYERIQCYKFPANSFSKTLKYILVINNSNVYGGE